MCEGAFGPSSSSCLQAQPSSTIFSSACSRSSSERRVDVLVDRHAGGRVRHVDERGRGAVRPVERLLDLLRDVEQLRPPLGLKADLLHRRISYGAVPSETPTSPASSTRIRAEADRFIAELDEEYYLHYAGLKDTARARADLRAPPDADGARERAGARRARRRRPPASASSGASRCEGYIGKLTREHAEKRAAARGRARGHRRRRDDPVPDAAPGDRERARPRAAASGSTARSWEATEEHLNPIYLEALEVVRASLAELGAPNYVELYERFGFRARRARRPVPRPSSTRPRSSTRTRSTGRSASGSGSSLDEAQRWDLPRLIRAPQWDEGFPAEKMVPALEATLADLGIDLDASRTSTSTSSSARRSRRARSARRSRCPTR